LPPKLLNASLCISLSFKTQNNASNKAEMSVDKKGRLKNSGMKKREI